VNQNIDAQRLDKRDRWAAIVHAILLFDRD
jgi:hypothetical protein